MFYYVEYLRGLRALRVIGMILAICLVLTIAVRLWAQSLHTPDFLANSLQSSPTAHVTSKVLPDRTTRTIIDDPAKRVHAVIDRQGKAIRIDATMPSSMLPTHKSISMAEISSRQSNGMSHTVISYDRDADIDIGILFGISCVFGLITATMLAGPLAKENESHLEIAWTKPVSRDRFALASMAVDIAAIVASQLATILVGILVLLMYVTPHFYGSTLTLTAIALSLLGPIAWYACLTAFSASLKRGLGMVCGLGWLAALFIPGIATATGVVPGDPIWGTVHAIFMGLAYIDPIAYISFHGTLGKGGLQMQTFAGSFEVSVIALVLLSIGYLTLAVLQWRRVEA